MGSTDSYSLLKMKLKEIGSSKKSETKKETRENEQNSNTSKPTLPSSQQNDGVDPDIPDHSYGDFYCRTCDSHMNSQGMWNSHITGKKHQKNVTKCVPDTKYEDLNVQSCLKYELRNVKDTIVGLSYIQEIRRKEPGIPPFFTCFLCDANCATVAMIIEHVISFKHRFNYIKENSHENHELLAGTKLKKGQMEPLVAEMVQELEEKFGSGSVQVKQEKRKPSSWPSKQPITHLDDDLDDRDDDDDDDVKMDRIKKPLKRNPYVWKAVDHHKRDNVRDIKDCRDIIKERRRQAYISDEEEDTYLRKNPVKRTSYNHSKRKRSISPSPKREKAHLKTSNHSPSEHYNYSKCSRSIYSRSLSQELLKKNEHSSRKSTHSPIYKHSHSRTQIVQEESGSNHSLRNQPKNMESDSRTDPLKDFASFFLSVPTDTFLKLVIRKLETFETLNLNELNLLSQVVSKAQNVIYDKLAPLVRQKMSQNVSGPQQTTTSPNPVAECSTEIKHSPSSISCIRSLIDQAKAGSAPSVTPIESPHYSSMSYAASSHADNPSFHPSNQSQSFSIPGLTLAGDSTQAYASSLSAYQSQYSNPPSASLYSNPSSASLYSNPSSANHPQYQY